MYALGAYPRPMRSWKFLLGVAVVIGVGELVGYRWVLAPIFGFALYRWLTGSLRAMVTDARGLEALEGDGPRPVSDDERTLYWCEDCGTEVLLVVRGNGRAPRHCGSAMHERVELLN